LKARAAIVVVGSEILRGVVQDTNSHYLAKRLTELGFSVTRIIAVPDSHEDIAWALRESMSAADVVVATGGLGFTRDDITLEAAAAVLGRRLVLSAEALEMVKSRLSGEVTYQVKAAYIPEGSKPLYNPVGVSPGVYLRVGEKHLFFLPGVPREMVGVFEESVAPLLLKAFGGAFSKTITVVTRHEREAEVDELIAPLRSKYPDVYFKTHATTPVRLSVTITAESREELEEKCERVVRDLKSALRAERVEAS